MFFVVGTGRCGTMTVASWLNQSPDAVCYHEPNPTFVCENTAYAYGEMSADPILAQLRETRTPLEDGKVYGEVSHTLSELIPLLKSAFPEAKYIWLMREGRATVTSMAARGWYTPWVQRNTPYNLKWVVCRIRGDKTGAMSAWQWHSLTAFEKCCWYWGYRNERIKTLVTQENVPWIALRLEDLNDAEESQKVLDFLELAAPITEELPHENAHSKKSRFAPVKHDQWTTEQRKAFVYFCEPIMDEYYPGWRDDWDTQLDPAYRPGHWRNIPWNVTAFALSSFWQVRLKPLLKRILGRIAP